MVRPVNAARRHLRVAAPLMALISLVPVLGLGAEPAAADPVGTISVYNGGVLPTNIIVGPDGNLWFGGYGDYQGGVGRVTTDGVFLPYLEAYLGGPESITVGPNGGGIWFVDSAWGIIGKMTTAGAVTTYPTPWEKNYAVPASITTGPDGRVWVAYEGNVAKVTTSGVFTVFDVPGSDRARSIVEGPDGNMWFSTSGGIGKVTTTGAFTMYTHPSMNNATDITVGPDGNLWFANSGSLGRITTGGEFAFFTHPGLDVDAVGAGPDGGVWFVGEGQVGSVSRFGTFTVFPDPDMEYGHDIVEGPDGRMWYTATNYSDDYEVDPPFSIRAIVPPTGPGEVRGTVTEEGSGAPLDGVSVRLMTTGNVLEAVRTTAADGSYAFEDLPPGEHHVRFIDLDGSHANEWYDDRPSKVGAATVEVTAGASTAVHAALSPTGGSVEGTVLEEGTGTPLPGISVRLLTTGNVLEAVTTTAADGSYSFPGVAVGDHLVRFIDPDGSHQGEFHLDAATRFDATVVAVAASVATVNAHLTLLP